VAPGFVADFKRDANLFNSFVVIQDEKNATANTGKWTFKHIDPDPALKIGAPIKAGDPIGRVVKNSEESIQAGYPTHVHIDRGTGTDPQSDFGQAGVKTKPVPWLNALTEFDPALDQVKPTIEDVLFRPAKEDLLGNKVMTDVRTGYTKEQLRTTAKLFSDTTTVRNQSATLVGKLPDPWVDNQLAAVSDTGVDIIANMYDRFAAAVGAAKLNVALVSFSATGQCWDSSTGTIASFNFSSIADPITSFTYFANFERTRSIYSNDSKTDSGIVGPFYYSITNTPSREAVFGEGGKFPENARELYYWTTDARSGEPWNIGSKAPKATRNGNAEYPDDVYEVTIETSDVSGNTITKTVRVLLDNWRQKLTKGAGVIQVGKDIVVQKAEQFNPNQQLEFYVIPNPGGGGANLANGTALPAGKKVGIKQVDANGEIKNYVLKNKAPAAAVPIGWSPITTGTASFTSDSTVPSRSRCKPPTSPSQLKRIPTPTPRPTAGRWRSAPLACWATTTPLTGRRWSCSTRPEWLSPRRSARPMAPIRSRASPRASTECGSSGRPGTRSPLPTNPRTRRPIAM